MARSDKATDREWWKRDRWRIGMHARVFGPDFHDREGTVEGITEHEVLLALDATPNHPATSAWIRKGDAHEESQRPSEAQCKEDGFTAVRVRCALPAGHQGDHFFDQGGPRQAVTCTCSTDAINMCPACRTAKPVSAEATDPLTDPLSYTWIDEAAEEYLEALATRLKRYPDTVRVSDYAELGAVIRKVVIEDRRRRERATPPAQDALVTAARELLLWPWENPAVLDWREVQIDLDNLRRALGEKS